jgi:predicted Fe-Mo cluster-binding NifX family protein
MNSQQQFKPVTNGKVAFVTDDGTTISAHFGRAQYYEVITINNGAITSRERISKLNHHSFQHSEGHSHGNEHRHGQMTAPIEDCDILVARGMGMGAYNHLQAAGISVLLIDTNTIDEALQELLQGKAQHNSQRLHEHGNHIQ